MSKIITSPLTKEQHILFFGDEDIDQLQFEIIDSSSLDKFKQFKLIYKILHPNLTYFLTSIDKLNDIKRICKALIKDIETNNTAGYFIRIKFLSSQKLSDELKKIVKVINLIPDNVKNSLLSTNNLFSLICSSVEQLNILSPSQTNYDITSHLIFNIEQINNILKLAVDEGFGKNGVIEKDAYTNYKTLEDLEMTTHLQMLINRKESKNENELLIFKDIPVNDLLTYSVIVSKNKIIYFGENENIYFKLSDLFNRRSELGDNIKLLKVRKEEDLLGLSVNYDVLFKPLKSNIKDEDLNFVLSKSLKYKQYDIFQDNIVKKETMK